MTKAVVIFILCVGQSVSARFRHRGTKPPTISPGGATTGSAPTIAPVQAPFAPTTSPQAPTVFAPVPSDLSVQWLSAHNTRRTSFFTSHNLSPKDLKWSSTVAASAQAYADSLLSLPDCTIEHGYQGNSYGGENLAANWGGQVSLTPEGVLQLWYDAEQSLPFGENLHFSQVVWRGTSYFGCGISNKTLSDGTGCFIQACRYIAPGNCNVDSSNLLSQALQDSSPCPPFCPSEGCF